jgi:serine/threonine protein kinase
MPGDAPLHAGDRIADRFVLQTPIGAGGSGEVWRALDEQLRRTVALKVLRHASVDDERRLRREARALAAVRHPHIVGVYDVVDGPPPVLVLEFVAGRTLRSLLDERLLRVDEIKALARALASALNTAHDAGVVHGDVKPENVLVDDTLQRICLVDFGLAAPIADANVVDATRTLSIRGTPGYLAPEVIEARVSDAPPTATPLASCCWSASSATTSFARRARRRPSHATPSVCRPTHDTPALPARSTTPSRTS